MARRKDVELRRIHVYGGIHELYLSLPSTHLSLPARGKIDRSHLDAFLGFIIYMMTRIPPDRRI